MLFALVTAAWAASSQASGSTAQALAAELAILSDSLGGLRGTIAIANRDLAQASPELLLARARELRARCAGADGAAGRLDSLARRHAAPAPSRPLAEFRRELHNLRAELARCREEWGAREQLDSLRAWGPHRLARLDDAVRRYEITAVRLPEYPKTPAKDRVGMGRAVDSHFHNRVEIARRVYPAHG